MAIGTPFGLARTLTLGVVSNNERTFYPEQQKIDEYETGEFNNWIQMDTPINPGNSGGPLVDMTGKVVGINTRGRGQNLNFAVPIDTAKEVIAKILASAADGTRGKVVRSDLGIDQIVSIMSLGGIGVISVLANIIPKKVHEIAVKCLEDKYKEALDIQLDTLSLANTLFIETNPIPIKTAMNLMGLEVGPLRLPLCEMDSNNEEILKAALIDNKLM